jgi:hypothetical protein
MSTHRITSSLAVAVAAVAVGAPASYGGQPSLSAAAHLEVHANADTSAAQKAMRTSSARARRLMARGTRELSRAAAIVSQADAQTSASGDGGDDHAVLTAQASLSLAAADQSETLAALAGKASGRLQAAAQRARTKAEGIRSRADAALDDQSDEPGVVSVSVSADADAGSDSASADDGPDGIELLGMLSGGGE